MNEEARDVLMTEIRDDVREVKTDVKALDKRVTEQEARRREDDARKATFLFGGTVIRTLILTLVAVGGLGLGVMNYLA